MVARTHDLFAFTALNLVLVFGQVGQVTLGTAMVGLAAVFLGGLAPDLDEGSSVLWQRLPAGSGTILGKIVAPVFGSHRFISHSLVGLVIFDWVAKIVLAIMGSFLVVDLTVVREAFLLGLVSHLVADSLTREGIPLLWPVTKKFGIPPISWLRVKTGSWMEKLVVFPGLLVFNGWLIYTKYDVLLNFIKNIQR